MKTWRERIADAEKAGWTDEDMTLWADMETCPAAEVAARYGIDSNACLSTDGWGELWLIGNKMGRCTKTAVDLASPRVFADYMDRMEDRALQLKREEA
jgi:hypothetical protein